MKSLNIKIPNLIIFWIYSSTVFCQCDPISAFELIKGKWYPYPLVEGHSIYNADSTYDAYYYGEYAKAAIGLINVDTISPWEKGERGFFLSCKDDTLLLNSFYLKNYKNDTTATYILSLTETELIILSFKQKDGLRSHIDGVGLKYRNPDMGNVNTNINISGSVLKTQFLLKPEFQGYVVVMYDGVKIDKEENGNDEPLVISIPESGLAETNRKADPMAYAKKQLEFYYENNREKKIPIVPGLIRGLLSDTTHVKEYLSQFNENEVCVATFGYNQFSREKLNKKFGKDLKGNAEIYYVGPLKNVIGKSPKLVED